MIKKINKFFRRYRNINKKFLYICSIVCVLLIIITVFLNYNVVGKLDVPFKINIYGTATIKNDSLKIKFSDVIEDSRCPLEYLCDIFAPAKISLLVSIDDQNKGNINISEGKTVDIAGYSITLLVVKPYPKSHTSIMKFRYSANLVVSKTQ